MTISTPVYCTREDVKAALDFKETARNNGAVDRALESSARSVEDLLHRKFYPLTATRYFDWPNYQYARPWRLWLDDNDLASASAVTSGGVTIAPSDYFLEPVNSGPPYTNVQIDLASSAAFGGGTTYQRSVSIAGVWCGSPLDESPAGALAAAIISASATTCDVTDSASIGVGSILRIDTERMLVTGKSQLTTGQTVQTSALTASAANETVLVTTGSAFTIGEVVTVDAERMLVVDITSNALTVKRAWDGSTLAAHNTGVTIYAPRTLTVIRGALGTTASTHLISAPIVTHVVPSVIRQLAVAESCNTLLQTSAGYGRSGAEGSNVVDMATALGVLRKQAQMSHGRLARTRAV